MDLVERSDPVIHWSEDQQSTPEAIASVVAKVARAVHYAHESGVFACELTPRHVLIDEAGEPHVTSFRLVAEIAESDPAEASAIPRGWRSLAPEERRREPHAP